MPASRTSEVNDSDGRAPDMLAKKMVVIVQSAVADERDIRGAEALVEACPP